MDPPRWIALTKEVAGALDRPEVAGVIVSHGTDTLEEKADAMPYVEIVPMYGGADGRLIKAALDLGAKGIVVEGLGWGNVNQPMFAAIKEAIAKGVPVVIASRVPNGRVLPNYGWEGGGKTLVDAGAVMADDLPPHKARILLMLLLQSGVSGQKPLQEAFSR